MAKPEESWASTILSQFGIAVSADLDKDTKIPSTLPYTCEQCESIGTNRPSQYDPSQSCNYCNGCNEIYCNKCWAAQGPHRRNTLTITGVPHEKTDPNVADLVRATLQSNPSKDEQQRLYQDDENATWFGLVEIDGEPTFRDYGRYVDLMGQIVRQPSQRQYPSLVSFVGPAGAGKSSLIKMLIELGSDEKGTSETPVVGRLDDGVSPTSGDVHLYPDPISLISKRPILYADCEGIQGGDSLPKAAESKHEVWSKPIQAQHSKGKVKAIRNFADRSLKWAKLDHGKKRRAFAVSNLFPRILYTFSDVIVFVLRAQKHIEDTIIQLLDWAKLVAESSSNQPTLPHVIIALNATGNGVDPQRWNVSDSRRWLLSEIRPMLRSNPDLHRYLALWAEKGMRITSLEDLILRYYSSFTVVHIPQEGRPRLIKEQVTKLYYEIVRACDVSHERKKKKRMLLSFTDLQPYLSYAFDWFSDGLDKPFDFFLAAYANNPVPVDFGDHVLKLLVNSMLANHWDIITTNIFTIFQGLSYMIGSCIMLDCARERSLGLAADILPRYGESIDEVLKEFCYLHWPCEWVSPKKKTRCVNRKSTHDKGHQLKNGSVYSGEYISSFQQEKLRDFFLQSIYSALVSFLAKLEKECRDRNDGKSEEAVAAEIHRDKTVRPFYTKYRLDGEDSFSNTTCLICLMYTPEHRLPCGHILCTSCLKVFGVSEQGVTITISSCPMPHRKIYWNDKWSIPVKPTLAGTRILCLDGGGVRGIVELEILSLIQKLLDPIPLRVFFDLVVGTSTGGLVALGIGAKSWTIEKCRQNFESLCKDAFQPRARRNLGFLAYAWNAFNHGKYKTAPLEEALKKAYCSLNWKREPLFGGNSTIPCSPTKVAVVVATVGLGPVVMASYNRSSQENTTYHFLRQSDPKREVEIWQAARATSAAPTYFRSYYHKPTRQVYEDGGIYYNNPVEIAEAERKTIWPETALEHPDIMLSIGTGYNSSKHLKKPMSTQFRRPAKFGVISNIKNLKRIAEDHIALSTESQRTWNAWYKMVARSPEDDNRFFRLNVDCPKDPPALDDLSGMRDLREYTHEQYGANQIIQKIASHLVASSFYVNVQSIPSDLGSGEIRCRLLGGEAQLLGHWISKRVTDSYRPSFTINKGKDYINWTVIVISDDILEKLTKKGLFAVPFDFDPEEQAKLHIYLCLSDERQKWFMISGFPKQLNKSTLAETRERKTAPRPSIGQSLGLARRLSDWDISSLNLHTDIPLPDFHGWESSSLTAGAATAVGPAAESEEPPAETFSAETWSEHLTIRVRESVFELGDHTSDEDSAVESN